MALGFPLPPLVVAAAVDSIAGADSRFRVSRDLKFWILFGENGEYRFLNCQRLGSFVYIEGSGETSLVRRSVAIGWEG